jgi:hypothetical protein
MIWLDRETIVASTEFVIGIATLLLVGATVFPFLLKKGNDTMHGLICRYSSR